MEKIKVAIVGTGFGDYVIIQALKKIKNIDIRYIFGRNERKLQQICKKEGIKKYYTDYKKINFLNIDLLCIATTPKIQNKILKNLKNNKIEYLFVEKPPSDNLNNFNILYKKFEFKKLFKNILVDFIFLKIDAFLKFKKIIKNKIINKVNIKWHFKAHHYKFNLKKTWKTDEKFGGGIYYFYLIHVISYINYFFGSIEKIVYKKEKKNKSIYASKLKFILTNGIIVKLDFNSNSNLKQNIHSVRAFEKGSSFLLMNSSKDFVDGFKIKKFLKNKTIQFNFKKNYISSEEKKNKSDSRIKLVHKMLIQLLARKKNYPNFNDALTAMNDIEKCIKF